MYPQDRARRCTYEPSKQPLFMDGSPRVPDDAPRLAALDRHAARIQYEQRDRARRGLKDGDL